jgi:hypothetical protein
MPVVMDADFNGVWVEESDLAAYLDPNSTRPGPSAPAPADADNQDSDLVCLFGLVPPTFLLMFIVRFFYIQHSSDYRAQVKS